MSSEANDMNTIHRGNYEEFFILYMDNELSGEQIKMVDAFLAAHPDLKMEFDALMSTKLPTEEFSFDKKDLLAENMKLASVDEELLLYIDNELSTDQKKTVEMELVLNKNYQQQHQVLLQTKLDPSEIITYPHKKELYRQTVTTVPFKVWMRVAAAVVVIAISGLLYFRNSSSPTVNGDPQTSVAAEAGERKNASEKDKDQSIVESIQAESSNSQRLAVAKPEQETTKSLPVINKKKVQKENPVQQSNLLAQNTEAIQPDQIDRPLVTAIEINEKERSITETTAAVNRNHVTSSFLERTINEPAVDTKESIANNDRKGSIKGFLRKATRMIEKRTGFDPTNEDGELLIAAVAINLK